MNNRIREKHKKWSEVLKYRHIMLSLQKNNSKPEGCLLSRNVEKQRTIGHFKKGLKSFQQAVLLSTPPKLFSKNKGNKHLLR